MKPINLLFLTILQFFYVNCAIFLWSNKEVDIFPLQKFTDDDLAQLVGMMDNPKVMAYSNPNQNLPLNLKSLVNDSFSAYTANDDLLDVDTIALSGDETSDLKRIEKDVEEAKYKNQDTLFFIISPTEFRSKREIEEDELITTSPESKGPVAYIGKSITDEKYGIIYSSTPLLLRINKTDLYLNGRENDLTSVDTVPRESITRLNVNILLADKRKIMLRFIFLWADSYWYLTSVRISGTSYNTTYTLAIDKEVYAPEQFSYHCSGETVFSDTVNDVYLYLTNMQVQIDSSKESFGDSYDCISFTTVPIWSGIFVSSLLIFVLLLSLVALWDIKTMDKFDNYKTKQLTITVSE
ncbi:uncharacterized protein LOC123313439 [Coccinella septempunctata]|uniref:uncharacterized protein LOC123313439 n=1 Tax=Coccinella septempunctata TaxID=41139 RepID=UPI001D05D15E|nr:uncharacterized protein LOC123313439 [Coccinella septempunctata]